MYQQVIGKALSAKRSRSYHCKMSISKAAVFYHYFEKNDKYRDNLIYFLSVGYLEEIDFYIVISGECSIQNLPQKDNIFYIYTKNHNFDFGGYTAGINFMLKHNKNYENYIFVNSSVRGPFLAPYSNKPWINIFSEKLDDNIQLVGSSINIPILKTPEIERFKDLDIGESSSHAHVQTTAYAMTSKAFNHLLSINFYDSSEQLSRIDVICRYEIRLSYEIIKKGWTIGCLLPEYNLIDYQTKNIDKSMVLGGEEGAIDRGVYFGRTANPMEILFIKTNRNTISNEELYSYSYTGILQDENRLGTSWKETEILKEKSLKWIRSSIANRISRSSNILYRLIQKIFK